MNVKTGGLFAALVSGMCGWRTVCRVLSVLSSGINCGSAPPDVRVAAARPRMGRVEDSPLPGAGRLLAADSGSMHRLKATAASEWSWAELGPGSSREAVTGSLRP